MILMDFGYCSRTRMTARRIGIVTVGRSDYGIYRPVLDAIRAVH